MKQVNFGVNRRGFLKGLGITAVGGLLAPTVLRKAAFAQAATEVSLYARLAGATRPAIELNNIDTEAWICLGDEVDLFWVTTPDVQQVDLGDDLGVFAADKGGSENGLQWGSVRVEPTNLVSYQLTALDGNFEATTAANVLVFGRPGGEGPFFPIEEGTFFASLPAGKTDRTNEPDEWQTVLSSDRFSPGLGITFIKPVAEATRPAPFPWNVTKIDEDGTRHDFSLAAQEVYQNPFTPAGTQVTIPVPGSWVFATKGVVSARKVGFTVKAICA